MPSSGHSGLFSLHSFSTSNLLASTSWSSSSPSKAAARKRQSTQPEQVVPAGPSPKHGKGSRSSRIHNPPQVAERGSSLYCANFAASTASLAFSSDPPRPAFYSHTNYTAFELSSDRRNSTFFYPLEPGPAQSQHHLRHYRQEPTVQFSAGTATSSSSSSTTGADSETSASSPSSNPKSLRRKWDALLKAAHIGGGKKRQNKEAGSKAAKLSSRSVYDLSSDSANLYIHPRPYGVDSYPSSYLGLTDSSNSSTTRMSREASSSSIQRPGQVLFESPSMQDLTDSSMPPPAKPARSRLRPAAEIIPALRLSGHVSSSELHLPMRALAVDPPLPVLEDTPSLASDTSSEHDHETEALRSPAADSIWKNRRRGYTGADPLKMRDGLSAKSPSSGVYTPTTFPGPQGSQASTPTGVYTPNTFALHPTKPEPQAIPGPSRSFSSSSSQSAESATTPQTPAASSSRFSAKSAMSGFSSGFKRMSSTISSTSAAVTPTWRSPPASARESYFPERQQHSRNSSWSSSATPGSTYASPEQAYSAFMPGTAGLGLGVISESQARAGPIPSSPAAGSRSRVVSAEEKKVKRKQVPTVSAESGEGVTEQPRGQVACHAL